MIGQAGYWEMNFEKLKYICCNVRQLLSQVSEDT